MLDLINEVVSDIWPLGWKNWSTSLVDVSSEDGVNLRTYANLKAW